MQMEEHEAGHHEAEPLLRLSPVPSYTLSNNGRRDEDDTDFEPTSELRSRRTTGGGGASEANSIFLSFDNIQYKVDSRSLLVRGFERVQQCLCCNANSPYETINDQSGLPTVDPTINSHANDHSQLPLKTILHGVSGALRGLVAVVGSSGAGKTSLMDILANRKLAGHTTLSGVVEVNGVAREFMRSDFKRMCAYITQDDVLQASLTVHECLSFAARLLLPSSMSRQQKEERVAQVLSMLNLTAVANTQIGGPFQRGISGGEMRRVSIGLEILTQPSILLADEVTSGLDSYSAWSVINVLAKMAHTGATTVVVNIHQPSSALFEMFDSVVLMAKGHIVYQGPVEHVLPYFRQQYNLELPRGWAACDFLLDIVSQKSLSDPRNNHSDLESIPLSSASSSSSSSSSSSPFISSSTTAGSESVASHEAKMARMAEDFRNSPQGQAVVQDIATARNAKQVSNRGRQGKFAVDWLTQFWVLLCRHVLLWRRDWISIVAQLVSYLVSGVVIGAMFSNIQQNGQQDEQLTLAISFSLDVFGIMSFLQLGIFIKERSLFNREIAANYYYTSSFFISKSLSTLPIHFVVGLPFSTILYFWIGFANRQFSEYLFFVLTCYMTQLTMAGLHEFVGATFRSMDSALVVAGTFNVLAMTLSGVTSNFPNLPVYLKPFYWLTPLTYSTSALLVTQFNNDDAGKAWLKEMGLQIYDRWESIWILAIFLVAFRFFTYLALRFLHRL